MVLTDYHRSIRGEHGVVPNNSIDIASISVGTTESRTRYGSLFAEISQRKRIKDKKLAVIASKFRRDQARNKEKPPRMIGDVIVTPMHYLTSKQRKRIVDTWKSIADRRQLGQRIYMQVFMHKPSLKMATVKCKHLTRWILLLTQTLFPFRDIPIGQLVDDLNFNRQSAIFADFLHTVVGFVQLDSENMLRGLCQRVGARHAQFTSVDFEPDWWRLFVSAVLDCLQAYFPPSRHSTSIWPSSSNMLAQLPLVGPWIRDSYKRAWTALLEHTVQLMREAFANYRNQERRRCSSRGSDFERSSNMCIDRNSSCEERRIGTYNQGMDFEMGGDDRDPDDEDVELQLVIVTTPVDIEVEQDKVLYDGGPSYEPAEMNIQSGAPPCCFTDVTTALPTECMTTSFSLQQQPFPLLPRSWEPTRKPVLRLSSLEDWDLSG